MMIEKVDSADRTDNAEQQFMRDVQKVQVQQLDLAPQLQELEQWLASLLKSLQLPSMGVVGANFALDDVVNTKDGPELSPKLSSEYKTIFAPKSSLVQGLTAIDEQMQAYPQQWAEQWKELKPAVQMADIFADKLIL